MKKRLICLGVALSLLPLVLHATVQNAADQFISQIDADANSITGWFSGQLSNRVGFLSGIHMGEPPQSLQLVDFEIAGLAGFDDLKLDLNSLKALPLAALAPVSMVAQAPSYLPLPYMRGRMHIGLPSFLFFHNPDLGLTAGGLTYTYQNVDAHLVDYGAEIRSNLIEDDGFSLFNLNVALMYDYLAGSIAYQDKYSQVTSDGTYQYNLNLSQLSYRSNIQNSSYAARVILSKEILVVTPYVGAAGQMNVGSTQTTTGIQGSLTVTDSSSNSTTASVSRSYTATGTAPQYTYRALAGLYIELGPLDLNLGAEYDWINQDLAEHFGLDISF